MYHITNNGKITIFAGNWNEHVRFSLRKNASLSHSFAKWKNFAGPEKISWDSSLVMSSFCLTNSSCWCPQWWFSILLHLWFDMFLMLTISLNITFLNFIGLLVFFSEKRWKQRQTEKYILDTICVTSQRLLYSGPSRLSSSKRGRETKMRKVLYL